MICSFDQKSLRAHRPGLVLWALAALATAAAACAPALEEEEGEGTSDDPTGESSANAVKAADLPIAGNFYLTENFFNPTTRDYVLEAGPAGKDSLLQRGYRPVANEEGYLSIGQLPGMVPLQLYSSGARRDYFCTATAQGAADARSSGYTFLRTIGYVYSSQQPGTHPLVLYYHAGRGENFTTATNRQEAINAGYRQVRVEGYVYVTSPVVPLALYWHSGRLDNLHTAVGSSLESAARAAGYSFAGIDGYVMKAQVQGTVPLKNYWSGARLDHYATATAAGQNSAVAAGYGLVRTEGYVFPAFAPGTAKLLSLWHGGRRDHMTSVMRQQSTRDAGYSDVRTEGWAFANN